MNEKYRVVAKIDEIIGACPVYRGGEMIVFEGMEVKKEETDAMCIPLMGTLIDGVKWRQHLGMEASGIGWDYSKERQMCPRCGPPQGEGFVIISWEATPNEE